jgi:hypothetical protein
MVAMHYLIVTLLAAVFALILFAASTRSLIHELRLVRSASRKPTIRMKFGDQHIDFPADAPESEIHNRLARYFEATINANR